MSRTSKTLRRVVDRIQQQGGMFRRSIDDRRPSKRLTAFESFFVSGGAQLPGAVELQGKARRTFARQALWRASQMIDHGSVLHTDQVEEFVAFALEACPDARRLAEWRGLKVRYALGPGRSRWFPSL